MLSTLLLLISTTFAGKLADDNGFRGVKFGSASPLSRIPPMEDCVQNPYISNLLWYCKTNLREHPITVSYIAEENLFYAVILESDRYETCHEILDILISSWGQATKLKDRVYIEKYEWYDDPVKAIYEFNDLNNECSILIGNTDVSAQVIEIQKIKALGAMRDL